MNQNLPAQGGAVVWPGGALTGIWICEGCTVSAWAENSAATLSLSYIPLMSWVAVSPVILMDAGGLTTSEFAWSQVPVFSAVIIANLSVARWVKDPTRPRFVLSAVPVQMLGLAILIVGNLV